MNGAPGHTEVLVCELKKSFQSDPYCPRKSAHTVATGINHITLHVLIILPMPLGFLFHDGSSPRFGTMEVLDFLRLPHEPVVAPRTHCARMWGFAASCLSPLSPWCL